ncbi:unnamed protein product [Caenorhabditis angaria]|uniref:Uncharacterized protein n=1 Tax=Caenorhabditis angaria TaxID=860376 RepID=A0A9P1IZV1_9PELO|nr:unnamed protein product [Caenorhabditis angaria]
MIQNQPMEPQIDANQVERGFFLSTIFVMGYQLIVFTTISTDSWMKLGFLFFEWISFKCLLADNLTFLKRYSVLYILLIFKSIMLMHLAHKLIVPTFDILAVNQNETNIAIEAFLDALFQHTFKTKFGLASFFVVIHTFYLCSRAAWFAHLASR